jgi:hypothetical protein
VEVALQKKSEMKRKRAKAQVAWECYCEVLPRTAAIWMFVVMALLVALIFATRNSSLGEFATNGIGMCILVAGIWTLFKYNEKQLIIQKAKFARNHPDLYEVLFGPLGDQPVG